MKEIDQATDKLARQILNQRAKESCRRFMAGKLTILQSKIYISLLEYAACMKVEGLMGAFRCRDRFKIFNNCLDEK
jgi:hypothetical protein